MINIISGISVISVGVVSMALIIVLSAFNGLEQLVESLYESFDPDIKVLPATGKTFNNEADYRAKVLEIEEVESCSEVIEEIALIKYGDKQSPATIKGVDQHYTEMTGLDSMIIDGQLRIEEGDVNYALVGYKIAVNLSVNLSDLMQNLIIFAPRRSSSVSLNP